MLPTDSLNKNDFKNRINGSRLPTDRVATAINNSPRREELLSRNAATRQ